AAETMPAPLAALFRLRAAPPTFQVPIHLLAGPPARLDVAQGHVAGRPTLVALDRFEPLGRVDFSLAFDDVSKAINAHLEAMAPKACPEVEHVLNGDFSRWPETDDDLKAGAAASDQALVPDSWTLTGGTVRR